MNYMSICAGIEAASVAWMRMGWQPVAFSEIEPFPSAVLAHHYPDVPNLGDMTDYESWADYNIDLLCGGTPCQAFSVAGKRKGLDDDRGNLTLVFCRIADRYNPKWIKWENVPGILSSRDNAFGCFLAELCGADNPIIPITGKWPNTGVVAGPKRTAAWRVLDAQFVRVDGYPYAVPQRRRRLFVVARSGNSADPATVLFEPEGMCRNSPPRREERGDASRNASSGAHECSFPGIAPVAQTLNRRDYKGPSCGRDGIVGNPIAVCYENHPNDSRVKEHGDLSPTLTGRCGTGGGNLPLVQQHALRVRKLTPRECERLQGFPDDYTRIPWRNKPASNCPDGPRYKALGNSWAVNCARWIGERIKTMEENNGYTR